MRRILPLAILAVLIVAGVGVLLAITVFDGDSQDDSRSSYVKLEPGDSDFAEFPSEFDDFAIYWVGDEFGGHSLRKIVRQVRSPDDGLTAKNSVTFLYGSCGADRLRREGGCPYPLEIVIEPYCLMPRGILDEGTGPANIEEVRGGAVMVGSDPRLRTGDVAIRIFASEPGLMQDAIAALTSPNGLGVSAGEDMPPPAGADCSAYESVPVQ